MWYCGRLLLASSSDSPLPLLVNSFYSKWPSVTDFFYCSLKASSIFFLTAIFSWCVSWNLGGCDREITDSHELINLMDKELDVWWDDNLDWIAMTVEFPRLEINLVSNFMIEIIFAWKFHFKIQKNIFHAIKVHSTLIKKFYYSQRR